MQRTIVNIIKWLLVICLLGFAGYVDKVTGYEISAFPLYALPISLAAWYFGIWSAIVSSLGCVIVWYFADIATGHPYSEPWIIYVNACSRLVFFLFVAVSVSYMVTTLRRAQARLSAFTGTVDVCIECRNVRGGHDGYWWDFRAYLREYGGATIHSKVCPDCARRAYSSEKLPSAPTHD